MRISRPCSRHFPPPPVPAPVADGPSDAVFIAEAIELLNSLHAWRGRWRDAPPIGPIARPLPIFRPVRHIGFIGLLDFGRVFYRPFHQSGEIAEQVGSCSIPTRDA